MYSFTMIKSLIILSAFCIANLFSTAGHTQTVTSHSYVSSSQNTYSLNQLEELEFIPYEGVLNRGYGNDYLWLKLRVEPDTENKSTRKLEDWILRIRPTYLGKIALFETRGVSDPTAPMLPQRFSGQKYAMNANGYDSINHGFKIEPSDDARDIYLRLKTSTTRLINAEILSESKAYEEDRKQLVLTSSFVAILLFLVCWSALQWLILRERLLALFVIKQAIVLAFGITNLGFMKMLFGASANWEFIDSFVKINNFTYVGMYYFFEITFLSYFVNDKRYCRYAYLVLVIWGIALTMFLAGYESLGLQINMLVPLISPAIFLFLVSKTKSTRDLTPGEQPPLLSRRILVGFYLFYILAAYWIVLPNIGIVKAKDFMLTFAVYVSVVSSVLMATMLMLRSFNINRQKIAAEAEAGLAQQRLQQEKEQREQQSRFISMLTHELKTPISVAKLSLDAMATEGVDHDRIQRALENMNDVVERCRISDALDGHRFEVRRESFDLRETVFEHIDLLQNPNRVKVFEGNNVFIYSDSQLVRIIVANLLDNALKYSPDQSDINVQISHQIQDGRAGASLLVTNLIGPTGIPDADKVFQKYYRAKKAEGKSGSGLGLYLTAGIADLLGGQVSYRAGESRIEFDLWLPD